MESAIFNRLYRVLESIFHSKIYKFFNLALIVTCMKLFFQILVIEIGIAFYFIAFRSFYHFSFFSNNRILIRLSKY
jgi:hypothetical protein